MYRISACGYQSQHQYPCDIEHRNGLPEYLLLITKTPAWFYIDHKKIRTEANMVILFSPGTPIHYSCEVPGYNDDWIHFTCHSLPQNLKNLTFNTPLYPAQIQNLSHLVLLLTNVFYSEALHREAMLSELLSLLILTMDDELGKADSLLYRHKYYNSLSRLRTEIYNNPAADWWLSRGAQRICLSISYFQHLYKSFFGCSFQTDLIRARLELAKFYLTHGNMNIQILSEYCGYENDVHFMRQFKKYEGMTPSRYRSINNA